MRSLFKYKLPLKNGSIRAGLILQCEDRFAEIAPLPQFSKETLLEAQIETLDWIQANKPPTLPSVKWGIECVQNNLQSVHLPLCALNQPRENFSTLKLKLGHLPLNEAISLVKRHLQQVHLRLDCNRAWSLSQALEFASHFKPTDFEYLEEPLQNFEELITFSQKTHFPIALDESIHQDWHRIFSLKAIIVKPMIVGSIPIVPPPLQLILSSAYESGLGLLHIANRVNNLLPVGLDTYQAFAEDLLIHPIECSNGYFSWKHTHPYINREKLDLLCAL